MLEKLKEEIIGHFPCNIVDTDKNAEEYFQSHPGVSLSSAGIESSLSRFLSKTIADLNVLGTPVLVVYYRNEGTLDYYRTRGNLLLSCYAADTVLCVDREEKDITIRKMRMDPIKPNFKRFAYFNDEMIKVNNRYKVANNSIDFIMSL